MVCGAISRERSSSISVTSVILCTTLLQMPINVVEGLYNNYYYCISNVNVWHCVTKCDIYVTIVTMVTVYDKFMQCANKSDNIWNVWQMCDITFHEWQSHNDPEQPDGPWGGFCAPPVNMNTTQSQTLWESSCTGGQIFKVVPEC